MASSPSDRNLLFGVLALQMDFIGRDALIAAMQAWVFDKTRSLGEILVEQQALGGEQRQLLEALVQEHLRLHGNDPKQSLAALSSTPSDLKQIEEVNDADVHASLNLIGTGPKTQIESKAALGPSGQPLTAGEPRFRILRPYARGGLGEVFVARDEELHREVALKEIQTQHADEPQSRKRFVLEAEITGGLEHPGVVPVYGLGQYADGRPFYAMRFIRGDSLADAIARFQKADGPNQASGQRALELHKLLRRLVDVCNAVAYAHSRGVLHRDLKPSNIMLGKYGETLVVDWGLAKVLGEAEHISGMQESLLRPPAMSESQETVPGSVVGTPSYMSPEQAMGRVDQLGCASDVYSLGATLYCLLTGEAPVRGSVIVEVLAKVGRGEFPRPRELKPDVPPALEAICLKAMALQPADRYPSPKDLAEDLERWLADEPVLAYREPWTNRIGRWARRHRTGVVSASFLMIAAVVGLTGGLFAVNAERQQTERARADEARRRQQARDALDALTSEIVEDWLARQAKLTEPQKKFLERALASYEEFAQDTGQNEASRAGVAHAYFRVADIQQRLGQLDAAERAFRTSRDLYGRLVIDFPQALEYRLALARGHNRLGLLCSETGRLTEAETIYRLGLAMREQLVNEQPDVPSYRDLLAESHHNLGMLLHKQLDRLNDAEAEFRKALVFKQSLIDAFPDNSEFHSSLARTHNFLGILLGTSGRRDQAGEQYQRALALRLRLVAEHPKDAEYLQALGETHNNFALFLRNTGQPKKAIEQYRQAIIVGQQLAADFPAVPDYLQDLAKSRLNFGIFLFHRKQMNEAEQQMRDSLTLYRRLTADMPTIPEYWHLQAASQLHLGALLAATQRIKEAEAEYRETLQIRQRLVNENPTVPAYEEGLALGHQFLGGLFKDTERFKEAEAELEQALAHRQRLAAAQPDQLVPRDSVALTLQRIAEVKQARKDFTSARTLLNQALSIQEKLVKQQPNDRVFRGNYRDSLETLAELFLNMGDHSQAAAAVDRLPTLDRAPQVGLYDAACMFSRCVPLAEKDLKLQESERRERSAAYAERAMQLLRQAIEKGYADVKNMREDKDLDPLRKRTDFQDLIKDLDKGT